MRGKRFTAVLLSAVLTAAGAMTAWALPTAAEMSSSVLGEFPKEGGHVGFPEGGRFPGDLEYLPRRVMKFFGTGC